MGSGINGMQQEWNGEFSQSTIWDPNSRRDLLKNKLSEALLNERRRNALIPGSRLHPCLKSDTQIPIMVWRQYSSVNGSLGRKTTSSLMIAVPNGWALPLWRSMVWAGARPGGLAEHRRSHQENSLPHFPYDFPLCKSNQDLGIKDSYNLSQKWKSRPAAKRVNYKKLGISSPFLSDWTFLFKDVETLPWLISPSLSQRIYAVLKEGIVKKNSTVANIYKIGGSISKVLWSSALLQVRLQFVSRGSAPDRSIVYAIRDSDLQRWKTVLKTSNWMSAQEFNSPNGCTAVGFVTTGGYSLAAGRCTVLAAVRLTEMYVAGVQSFTLGYAVSLTNTIIFQNRKHNGPCSGANK
jgi:ribonuclease P/MRP protein subunit POP1